MASWLSALSLVLIGIAPAIQRDGAGVVRQRVDLVEVNHFIDSDGRESYRQVIFYDWSKAHHRFHVRAWRLIKNDSQIPVRRWNPPRYQCTWHDDGLLRQVWASQFRETWTQQDPERLNKAFLPDDQRIPLHVPKLERPQPKP